MKINYSPGFTLIETLMVMVLAGIVVGISLSEFEETLDDQKFDETLQEMIMLKHALLGNPTLVDNGQRIDFGYLGDVGKIPSTAEGLSALVTQPGGVSAVAFQTDERIRVGWNGPYVTGRTTAEVIADAWGNNYTYDGNSTPGSITSLGADGAAGGTGFDQDITVSLPGTQRSTTIYGFVNNNGSAYNAAVEIELYYPDGSGNLTTDSTTIGVGNFGRFSFAAVPFGRRSFQICIGSCAAPTQTLGVYVVTIDQPNYTIPPHLSEMDQ